MISSLDPNSQAFLDNLNKIGQRMQKAQREMSTGKRFNSVSDDPDQVSILLQARANLEATKMVQSNLGRVKAEADSAEVALQSAVKVLERVRVLGAQGATGTATAESRATNAIEVGALLEQLGAVSRTTIEGRYIFSGDSDHTPPYSIDLTAVNPIGAYAGAMATREVQHPNGTRFSVARTAAEIFDSPQADENVFYSVSALRTALEANDETGIRNSLENVIGSIGHLNGHLSYYGAVQNKVAAAEAVGNTLKLQLTAHISALEDADITESILDLQQSELQQQAALQAWAQRPRSTLFDYLG